ncbi:MAG: ABC transporter substrate-binding protein [Firmicutes bacterium]|nr:ABC transporter substrate-binding protein [Bacillota bacterium]
MDYQREQRRQRRRRIRRRNRRIALVAIILLLALAVVAGKTWRDGSLQALLGIGWSDRPMQLGMVSKIKSLDPILIQEHPGRMLGANIYEGLVAMDPETLNPVPALAESWKVSSDARVYTFKLRRGVEFHSGREFTATDVKRSWERATDPVVDPRLRNQLYPIQGAREALEGKASQIVGIEIVSNYEVRVSLDQPIADFISRCTMPPFWVFDAEVLTPLGKKTYIAGMPSAGTGPYMLQEWTEKQAVLAANPNYWGKAPNIKQAVFTWYDSYILAYEAYKNNGLDYLDEVDSSLLPAIVNDPQWSPQVLSQPLLNSYFFQFNMQDPVWGRNLALRQAVNYAVNRDEIVEKVFVHKVTPLTSLVPAGVRGYQPPKFPYAYDPAAATRLLQQSGYPDGQGLPVLEIVYNDYVTHKMVAEAVKEQLAKVGIKAQPRPVSAKDYLNTLAQGKYPCFDSGWYWDFPDPDDLFFTNFHSSWVGVTNYGFLKNEQVDGLLGAARIEVDESKRFEKYQQVEKIFNDEAPIVWLFSMQRVAMVKPSVRGLKVNPLDFIPLNTVGIREND